MAITGGTSELWCDNGDVSSWMVITEGTSELSYDNRVSVRNDNYRGY